MEAVTFFGAHAYDEQVFNEVNKAHQFGYKLNYFRENLTAYTACLAQGSKVVCIFVNDVVNADVIEVLHKSGTELLALRCAGFNNVDLKAAKGKIKVVRVPAYSPYAVAEYTLGLMLTLNRKIHCAVNRTHEGNFSLDGLLGFDMHQKTIGVIGTGKIAKVLIRILQGMGMHILAYDVFQDETFAKTYGVRYVPLDTLFSTSDIITLHCPLTSETRHIINTKSLEQMKPGVMIINTGRGQLIDTHALIKSLKQRHVGSVALDVYENEGEYFYQDHSNQGIEDDQLVRLLSFKNVIVTSHQAFFTQEALTNIAKTTLENIQAFFANQPLVNEVSE